MQIRRGVDVVAREQNPAASFLQASLVEQGVDVRLFVAWRGLILFLDVSEFVKSIQNIVS